MNSLLKFLFPNNKPYFIFLLGVLLFLSFVALYVYFDGLNFTSELAEYNASLPTSTLFVSVTMEEIYKDIQEAESNGDTSFKTIEDKYKNIRVQWQLPLEYDHRGTWELISGYWRPYSEQTSMSSEDILIHKQVSEDKYCCWVYIDGFYAPDGVNSENEYKQLWPLKEGDLVTFRGTLIDWGFGNYLTFILGDVRIISIP